MTAPFDTSLLDAARRRRREELEAERVQLSERTAAALKRMRDVHGIGAAYIVGSLVRPHAWRTDSDVDVAVSGCSDRVLEIMGALEEATGRAVDVVDLDRHPRADSFRAEGRMVYG